MYDYGPERRLSLELVGAIKEKNNGIEYKDIDTNMQEALQLFCHAIYQLRDEARMSPGGVLHTADGIMLLVIGDSAQIVMPDMMEAMHVLESDRSPYAMDIECFSSTQLMKCQPFLDYAEWHAGVYGRVV